MAVITQCKTTGWKATTLSHVVTQQALGETYKYRKISFGKETIMIGKTREECRAGFAILAIFSVIASYRPLGLNKKST